MNKKFITMATSLVVGGSLLLGTGLANASQLSGYEAYKTAAIDTKNLKNETVDLKLSVVDNGSNKANLSSNLKLNLASNTMSSTTTLKEGNTTQSSDSYKQDGESITKNSNSDQYLVRTISPNEHDKIHEVQNPTVAKSLEVVVDTLVGNMKDKVTTTNNADGTKNVTINLNENEVTPLVNALTSIGLTKGSEQENYNDGKDLSIRNVLPQLQSDIVIKKVNSTGKISKDDIITSQTAAITIEGKDAQGKQHEITLNVDLKLSNINNTTPSKIDLAGKQVKNITDIRGENKYK
ncbi:hypothetical protein [Clostridium pasteurianum]|uniref:Uncharacterized protein n=1 Tax=Clostridium pasteurianum BC1 TaxID=86416 RepID=R4KA08_CLOPA|nr:hypothetical protein [Clostridium pasteurianum]AGK96480.1 hypothetical protein Clopa_1541 [Clostridium pasteurianum BC1]